MLKIDHITGVSTRRVKDFSYSQPTGQTQILLCPSVKFLSELQEILQRKTALVRGSVTLDGKNYLSNSMRGEIQIIDSGERLFPDLSVVENVFSDKSFVLARSKRYQERFTQILRETDYRINGDLLVKNLSGEQRKIAEILHCYYMKPRLLIVRELSSIVSYGVFLRFQKVLDMLNSSGTTVLYLMSQWEETLKVSKDISLIINGQNQGEYSADEVRRDPSELCYITMGARHFQEKYNQEDREYDLFRTLVTNAPKAAAGHNIRNTLQMFANYLLQMLDADSVVTYLVDKRLNKTLENIAQTKNDEYPNLEPEMIRDILDKNGLVYLTQNDLSFSRYFIKQTTNQTVLCYPVNVNESLALLVQVGYLRHYTYTDRDTVIIEWVAQEMSVFIENSRLMGSSVLLRESHHRIKNNLQIIVSLMEMERENSFSQISDESTKKEMEDAFDSAIGRIKCIAQIHDLLTKENAQSSFMDMHMIVKSVSAFYQDAAAVNLYFESIYVPYSKAVSVALVINEIISNSIKHNSMDSEKMTIDITATVDLHSQTIHLTCKDNGVGYPCGNGMEYYSQSEGLGMLVIDSVIGMEFEGEYHFYNKNGAVVDMIIPQKALLPIEKREVNEIK